MTTSVITGTEGTPASIASSYTATFAIDASTTTDGCPITNSSTANVAPLKGLPVVLLATFMAMLAAY